MSDLISRKKVIDILEKEKSLMCGYDADIAIFSIEKGIRELPTAYDIDKVVYELDKSSNYYECEEQGREHVQMVDLTEAIEIVKQGGVSDDVCEWGKGSSGYVGYPAYYSKCCTTNSKGLEMQTHIISDWKFCPYCGKKIKIVGD